MDSNSPCKDLLFPHGPNLAQKPLYLVGTVLKVPHSFEIARALRTKTLVKAVSLAHKAKHKPIYEDAV